MSGHASRNREAERFIPSGCAECPTCHTIVHERRLAGAIPNSEARTFPPLTSTVEQRQDAIRILADAGFTVIDPSRARRAEGCHVTSHLVAGDRT